MSKIYKYSTTNDSLTSYVGRVTSYEIYPWESKDYIMSGENGSGSGSYSTSKLVIPLPSVDENNDNEKFNRGKCTIILKVTTSYGTLVNPCGCIACLSYDDIPVANMYNGYKSAPSDDVLKSVIGSTTDEGGNIVIPNIKLEAGETITIDRYSGAGVSYAWINNKYNQDDSEYDNKLIDPHKSSGYNQTSVYFIFKDIYLNDPTKTKLYVYFCRLGGTAGQGLSYSPMGYDGTGYTVAPLSNIEVYFDVEKYEVSIENDAGINSTSGGGEYAAGVPVSVAAVAEIGYEFAEWTGYFTSANNPYTFTMPETDVSLTATSKIACTIFTKVQGKYTPGSPYVKTSDGWKKGKACYIKVGNEWKLSTG